MGSIVDDIELMVKNPKEAAGLFKALILTDSKVYQRSDDSAGALQVSYARAEEGWAGCLGSLSDDEVYADIMEMLICECFGVRSVFSDKVPAKILQKIYDEFYENYAEKLDEDHKSFDVIDAMRLCAHYLKKPALYIQATTLDKEKLNKSDLLDISGEYRHAEDTKGVLDTLEPIKSVDEYYAQSFYELQVWAHEIQGREMDVTLA